MAREDRRRGLFNSRTAACAAALVFMVTSWFTTAQAAQAGTGDIGYVGLAFNGAGDAPTGEKPESKLWWNDGSWWGDVFDTVSRTYHIYRLDRPTETWVDTGVRIDDRPSTRADVLWDGAANKLYVASAVFAASSAANLANLPARLYRYSYNPATKVYTLDTGFPLNINTVSSETITLDKDSRGALWATWTQGSQVYVNAATSGDTSWGTPFVLPAAGATNLDPDDISAVAAYGNNRIGLMWSNQNTGTFYFATHRDGDAKTAWTSKVALSSPSAADDHINLKQLEADTQGHVYAAIKTSFDALSDSSAPQIELLALNPNSGNFDNYVYGTVADCHTRPILMIDSQNKVIRMYATAPSSGGCSFSGAPGTIYEKTAPLNQPSFPAGRGTPVIRDAASANMNNATSSKQNVTASTGIVIMASNDATRRYWHADLAATPYSPTASFTASPTTGAAPLPVSFSDSSSGNPTAWSWNFGDGTTSTDQNPVHTYTAPGTYTVSETVTASVGGTGSTQQVVTILAAPAPGTVGFGSASSGSQTVSGTGLVLTKPAGTAAGDFLVAAFTVDNTAKVAAAPVGWTPFVPALQPGNGASLYGYYHLVTAADDSVASWNWTLSSAQKWGGGISRYLNVDPNQPFDTNVSTALSNANVSSITVPSVTTVSAGAMLIGAVGADSATTAVTVPTGWTETWQSGAGQLSEHAYLGAPTPGASGTVTWTQSQARAIAAWTTALRPAVPHDPVIAAAGDIACDVNSTSYNGGAGTGTACMQRAVSDLLVNQPWDGILPLGDNQYESGQLLNFQRVYDPTWGRLRFVSYPIPGNHEYQTAGGAGYYSYYGAAAGDPAKGYYSYDLGKWHLIALNGECASVAGCGPGSAQEQWLAADLAAHPTSCTLAYWHEPRFSSGSEHGNDPTYDAFWRDLYGAGAEIVLNGHDHDYERFAPQTPDAVADTASGVREFVVGTGGINQMPFGTLRSNSDYRANGFGALRLTLHDGTYDWSFLSIDGSITDSGSGSCH